MISGPSIPNTLDSLRDLLSRRAELIEHGLRVITDDLVLGTDTTIDVLSCDATGAPVLQFLAVPQTAATLPARVLGAVSWWRQNAGFLARELSDPHLNVGLPPRFLVIGLEIFADTLEELRRIRVDGLAVAQLCSLTVGGRLRVGLTALLEPDPTGSPRDGFTVPEGIRDPRQRALAARFLDLMRRVDTGMSATGDRFSRRLLLHGGEVARLGLTDGELHVEFPNLVEGFEGRWMELTESTCLGAVDRMLRLVLAIELVAESEEREAEGDEALPPSRLGALVGHAVEVAECVPARQRVGVAPTGVPRGVSTAASTAASNGAQNRAAVDDADVEEDRFSLEPIRRSVARAQLSREEFSALGDEGSDSE